MAQNCYFKHVQQKCTFFENVKFRFATWKSEEGEREVRRDFTVAPTVTTFKLEQNILQLTFLPFHLSSTITSSVCLWWTLVLWEIGLCNSCCWIQCHFYGLSESIRWYFHLYFTLSHTSFFLRFWDQSEMETLLPVSCQGSAISQRSLSTTPAFPLYM